MLDSNRRLWKCIVFSALTGGIYGYYFIHKLAKDVNVVCAGDGEKTPGLWQYLLFGICTLGIYDLYWEYKLADRLQKNAYRYGTSFSENGATVLKWTIFGSLLFGIGPFIGVYIIIKNTNILVWKYQIGAGDSGNEKQKEESLQTQTASEDTVGSDFKCPKCGYQNEEFTLFCSKCGGRLEWSEDQMLQKRAQEGTRRSIAIVCIAAGLLVLFYLSYFFAWLPMGRNLSVCVGKKFGVVKLMHSVKETQDGICYMGDYILDVDPDNNIVRSIGKKDAGKCSEEKYNFSGIFYGQSQKEAKKYLKDDFINLGEIGYMPKRKPDYVLVVQYEHKKVSRLSYTYWKQQEREEELKKNAESAVNLGEYGSACSFYEGIRNMDVTQELEVCRYQYGKELYEKGAYLDAEKYFDKLKSDTYKSKKKKYLHKIYNINEAFHLSGLIVGDLNEWYDWDKGTTPSAHLIFDEAGIEKYEGCSYAYVVKSCKKIKADVLYPSVQAKYQLKLRRLSDDRICDADLGVNMIDAERCPYVNYVSSLDIVVEKKYLNVVNQRGEIIRQYENSVQKSYINSQKYSEWHRQLNQLRRKYY